MTGGTAFGSVPAAAVIAECLRLQSTTPAQSVAARVFGRSPLTAESRPWYVGALGELAVASRLASLEPTWTVLHSIQIGSHGSDIDHLVIGPPGVFCINTKFHDNANIWIGSERLLVAGRKTDYLRNSRHEAARTQRMLRAASDVDTAVMPMLVFVRPRRITRKADARGVIVLRDAELVRRLTRMPATIPKRRVEQLARVASAASTWGSAPIAGVDVMPAFVALQQRVRTATWIRVAWGTAALTAVAAVFLAIADGYLSSGIGL